MFLREWYGITYEPRLTDDAVEAIEHLETTEAGKEFDIELWRSLAATTS
jgi:hypothetical protein